MKKLLFVVYYEVIDYLSCIKSCFEEYNFQVTHYPLFRYAYDSNDKIDNYIDHMNDFIKKYKPDVILWWFVDVPLDCFKSIKSTNPDITYIMYNADDPINLSNDIFQKAKIFDLVVTPNRESIHKYKLYSNVKSVIHGPFGYDSSIYKKIENVDIENYVSEKSKFESDISMFCHNLFLDREYFNDQFIYKKDLIDWLVEYCNTNNRTLNLYGSHHFGELYPQLYKGDIRYIDQTYLFNFSKINIVQHSNKSHDQAINEYVMPILGSGGIMLVDKTKNIDKILGSDIESPCCFYMENGYNDEETKKMFFDKLDEIFSLHDLSLCTKIGDVILDDMLNKKLSNMRQKAVYTAKKYRWKIWVKNIIREYGILKFDAESYSKMYEIEGNTKDLIEHWCTIGVDQKLLAYSFVVPDCFNYEDYAIKKGILDDVIDDITIKKLYIDWYKNSRSKEFMKKKRNQNNSRSLSNSNNTYLGEDSSIDLEGLNLTMEQYYEICTILTKIRDSYKREQRDKYIVELGNICKQFPYTNINLLIEKFFMTV